MFALLIYGAQAFDIQRKVTLTTRTVTDLITQATPTQFSNGASLVSRLQSGNTPGIDTYLNVASSVLTPYASVNLSMVVSEVVVDAGGLTATVKWSEPYNGGVARTLSSKITLPATSEPDRWGAISSSARSPTISPRSISSPRSRR